MLADTGPQRLRNRTARAIAQARRDYFFGEPRKVLAGKREQASICELFGDQEMRQMPPAHSVHDDFLFHHLIGHRASMRAFDKEVVGGGRTARRIADHALGEAAELLGLILAATVVVWVHLRINLVGQMSVHWPQLDQQIFITIYDKPYAAIWTLQPLGTGTAILFATVLTAFVVRLKVRQVPVVVLASLAQIRLPALTTMLIIGLAYLMNYSGMTYTLGVGAASAGALFPLLSAFLGWLAVSLSGSDTSGNALFGNLQVVAARQLDLNPVLMAATNSSGGVFGKMISPQNISTGTSTTELKGKEGDVFARTFKHSLVLTFLLGLLVLLQQYVLPWMIPS